MATLKDLLRGDLIIADIKAIDKLGVIREFAAHVSAAGSPRCRRAGARAVGARSWAATGIGDSVAIPHGKLAAWMSCRRFRTVAPGVDYHSLDDQPAYLFFCWSRRTTVRESI
jgi:mannitol/fructose-specific phosphotransferase system IIA component (Ntr-type)